MIAKNPHYAQIVQDAVEKWLNEQGSSTAVINCLVEELTCDLYWLDQNISSIDRQILKEVVGKL